MFALAQVENFGAHPSGRRVAADAYFVSFPRKAAPKTSSHHKDGHFGRRQHPISAPNGQKDSSSVSKSTKEQTTDCRVVGDRVLEISVAERPFGKENRKKEGNYPECSLK